MDLELDRNPMEGYACALDTILYQEETQESIVPDACPDISAILCTQTRCQLTRKECGEGRLEIGGTVQVTVLYRPEEGTGPCRMELAVPYRAVAQGAVELGCPAVVTPRVTAAETRALNPRKVLCRLELAISCQVWRPQDEQLCQPCQDSEFTLQQRTEELELYPVMAVCEKGFAFTDEIELPAGQPQAESLLGHRLELKCGEAKVIGSKLIFKGEAQVCCRYLTADNALALGRWSLPFSQIMEVEGVEEEGACAVEVVERDSSLVLTPGGDGRNLSLHMELLAQATIRQSRTAQLFSDAYSITHDLSVERREVSFAQLWEEKTLNQSFRETVELSEGVREIKDCVLTLGPCQTAREEQEAVMTVRGLAEALYVDEAGELQALSRSVAFSCRTALPSKGECRCRCDLDGEVQAVVTAGGLELRCPVAFSYLITVQQPRQVVTALSCEERSQGEERPSVLLRLAQPGEGLWDIAKSCAATQESILQANDLDAAEDLTGRMLLIPRGR